MPERRFFSSLAIETCRVTAVAGRFLVNSSAAASTEDAAICKFRAMSVLGQHVSDGTASSGDCIVDWEKGAPSWSAIFVGAILPIAGALVIAIGLCIALYSLA